MELRAASIEDAAALAEVHVRSWQEAYAGQLPQPYLDGLTVDSRVHLWRALLAPDASPDAFAAIVGDEIVGFVTLDRCDDADAAPDTGMIGAIYVRAHAWDTGTGRALMGRAVSRLRERGFSAATLWVLDTNARARRFYEAAGWSLDAATRTEVIGGTTVTEVRYRLAL